MIGLGKTYELCLSGDIIDAQEALRLGMLNYVVPPEELMPATMKLAHKIANKAPIAVRLIKEALRRSLKLPYEEFDSWHNFAFQFCRNLRIIRKGQKHSLRNVNPILKDVNYRNGNKNCCGGLNICTKRLSTKKERESQLLPSTARSHECW